MDLVLFQVLVQCEQFSVCFSNQLFPVSWHIHTARDRDRNRGRELMGSNILYRNVHTGLTLGNETNPLSSIIPVPFPVPVPVPCNVNEPSLLVWVLYSVNVPLHWSTRKSSCVNTRGIPPAVYWVLLLLSYLGTPPLSWPGQGEGTWLGYPPPDLGGVPDQITPQAGYPPQLDLAGYPPAGPGRVHPPAGYPPGWTWQGTPWLELAGHPPWLGTPPAGPGRVPPPGACPMAFWEMLQSIMGYGYPPCG